MLSGETKGRPEPPNTRENEDTAKMTYSIIDFASHHYNFIQ